METENKIKYGPYFIYRDSTIIDARTGKKIKKHLRNGKYVVGLRMNTDKNAFIIGFTGCYIRFLWMIPSQDMIILYHWITIF